MSSHRQNISEKQKAAAFEDPDLDSGFCSSHISGPVSELLSSEIEHSAPQQQQSTASDPSKSEKSVEEEMDSAYCDSGMVSSPIETGMAHLSIGAPPLVLTDPDNKEIKNEHEVYFQQNEEGDTFLHLAIILPHPEVSKTLIRLAPQPSYLNLQNDVYLAPIHLAVLTSQPEIVRDLIIGGAKTTVRDRHGNTAMHLACLNGQKECLKQLLAPVHHQQIRHDLELWNYDGETCVHLAAKCCSTDIIKCLLEHGADINAREGKQGRTILHKACEEGNEILVCFLLNDCKAHLDIDAETYAGLTPYQLAASNAAYNQKYRRIVQELLKHGADTKPLPADDSDSDDEMPMAPVHSSMYAADNSCAVDVA